MPNVEAKVTLVRYTPLPDEIVAAAAKLCYAHNTENILKQDADNAAKFVGVLRRMGHMSPVEHASFTFYVEGASRAMTHQLVRHRLASYSQRSQRYVTEDSFDYVLPPQFEGKTVVVNGSRIDADKYFADTMAIIAERYTRLNDALGRTGESSNEDAQYVLPNACETKIFITMNARELLYFFEQRLCMRAQWEIRYVANIMLEKLKEVCQPLFSGAGPKCIRFGACPEGKMTCGQYEKMKERYAAC